MKIKINSSVFDKFPVLESERLIYRAFKKDDASSLFTIRSNNSVMKYMDVDMHESVEQSEKYINEIHNSFSKKEGVNWAIIEKSTNTFIGYFGFWRIIPLHSRAEIGYALNANFWGKGFMSETLKKLMHFGFNELNVHSIEANVNPKNEASIRLLEKIGFKKEAYFRENYFFNGKYIDSVIYSLLQIDLK